MTYTDYESGYGAAYASLLVLGGRLGDRLGRHRLFLGALVGFVLASLACGIAPNVGVLIAARIIQGGAAALLIPQVLATFHHTLEGESKARALALYGATSGIAAVVGQIVGGLLVSADIAGTSWRPIFLVNVPIGIVVLLIAARIVPNTRSPQPVGVDLRGTVLFAATLVALLVPLTEGHSLGWPWWAWLLIGLAVVLGAVTCGVERRAEARGEPTHLGGIGSGALITLQQSGLALGIATLGTLYISLEPHSVSHAFAAVEYVQMGIVALLAVGAAALPRFTKAGGDEPRIDA